MRRFKSTTGSRYPDRSHGRDPGHPSDDEPGHAGSESDQKARAKIVEAAAVRLLARREHSVEELSRKLQNKGHEAVVVEAVVARLSDKKLVSNERFASSFVHHHAQRGQGPIRIRAELRQQGITDESIEVQLKTADLDWNAIAATVRQRKFGATLPRTLAERAKQTRFLQYRGFNSDQIRAALGGGRSDERLAEQLASGDEGMDD